MYPPQQPYEGGIVGPILQMKKLRRLTATELGAEEWGSSPSSLVLDSPGLHHVSHLLVPGTPWRASQALGEGGEASTRTFQRSPFGKQEAPHLPSTQGGGQGKV